MSPINSQLDSQLILPEELARIKIMTMLRDIAKNNPRTLGIFDPKTNTIQMSPKTFQMLLTESTYLHEFTHMLDFRVFGAGRDYGSELGATKLFSEKIIKTKVYADMNQIRRDGFYFRGTERIFLNKEKMEDLDYNLTRRELFARASETFFAKRMQNQLIQDQILAKRKKIIMGYFPDEDILMLEKILEEVYYEFRLLK